MQFSDVPENLHACRQVNHSTSIPDDDDVGKPVKERNLIFFFGVEKAGSKSTVHQHITSSLEGAHMSQTQGTCLLSLDKETHKQHRRTSLQTRQVSENAVIIR